MATRARRIPPTKVPGSDRIMSRMPEPQPSPTAKKTPRHAMPDRFRCESFHCRPHRFSGDQTWTDAAIYRSDRVFNRYCNIFEPRGRHSPYHLRSHQPGLVPLLARSPIKDDRVAAAMPVRTTVTPLVRRVRLVSERHRCSSVTNRPQWSAGRLAAVFAYDHNALVGNRLRCSECRGLRELPIA